MKVLVGYTGFVGSNLVTQTQFDKVFNSSNIEDAFGLEPELLVYSGVPAEKFLANSNPEQDMAVIQNAIENIKKIKPKAIVLISTVDVYPVPVEVDEDTVPDATQLQAYGKNRLYLENWVEANFTDYLILRLPALFGNNIKKNFIFDIINIVPSMLSEKLYKDFSGSDDVVRDAYALQPNGFYKLQNLDATKKEQLKESFKAIGFSALNFTDSRAVFQFYNLKNLWSDIVNAQDKSVKKLNLATQPVSAAQIYQQVYGTEFTNLLAQPIPQYNFHTKHAHIFGKTGNYIACKDNVLDDITNFIRQSK